MTASATEILAYSGELVNSVLLLSIAVNLIVMSSFLGNVLFWHSFVAFRAKEILATGIKVDSSALDIKVGDENHIRITVKNGNVSNIYTLNIIRKSEEEEKITEEETTSKEDIEEPQTDSETKDNQKEETTPGPKENVPDPNPILNRVIVTLASLVGIAIGSLGIYFYVITSPKHMKKEILKYRNNKKDASNNESLEKENKKIEVKDDLVQTKEFKVDDNK